MGGELRSAAVDERAGERELRRRDSIVGRKRDESSEGRRAAEGGAIDSDCRREEGLRRVERIREFAEFRTVGEVCRGGDRAGASDGTMVEIARRKERDFHPEFES